MRKILSFVIVFICGFGFIGLVNADYVETDFVKEKCFHKTDATEYNAALTALAASYVNYSLDPTTGIFTASGDSYSSLGADEKEEGLFYIPQSKTLKAYALGSEAISRLGLADVGDNDVCIATATSKDNSGPIVDPEEKEDSNKESETSLIDDEDYEGENYVNNEAKTYADGTVASDNPNTGLSDYVIYVLPILLIGGSVLVFRKRFN